MAQENAKKILNPARILKDEHHEWVNTCCPASRKQVEILVCSPLKPKGKKIMGAPEKCSCISKCEFKKSAACLLRCSKVTERRLPKLNREEYAQQRAKLVEQRKEILDKLEAQGDFPDESLIQEHDANKRAIIDLDVRWEAEKRKRAETETFDQTLERLNKEQAEDHKRVNKMLCENDPLWQSRFEDKKAKIQRDLTLSKYHLDNLFAQEAPVRKEIARLEAELEQLVKDHENYEDNWVTQCQRTAEGVL